MSSFSLVLTAARLVGWVLIPLAVLGAAAFALIVERCWTLSLTASRVTAPHAVQSVSDLLATEASLPRAHVLHHWLDALGGPAALDTAPLWWLEAQLEAGAPLIEKSLNRGLWLLDTIVTAAPLVGLFGTVTGMMEAFHLIGADGLVNPSGVSGGVAQALIATAIGLVIAVISLIAFNALTQRVDGAMDELQTFGTRLLTAVRHERETQTASAEVTRLHEHRSRETPVRERTP
jgi:biopolymer transport protein ExbB